MRYIFLSAATNLVAWARVIVTTLNQRDAEIERRLKDAEDRLTAGSL